MLSYAFCIDEVRENNNASITSSDGSQDGIPSLMPGSNIRVPGGVSGRWWYCDGQNICELKQLPQGMAHYQTYSMFYTGGLGFSVLRGDATSPPDDEAWQPLRFDRGPDYSSYLCNVAQNRTVACRRNDQPWLQMLLPDIYYHSAPITAHKQYAGLKGELAIFLALVAFAMVPEQMPNVLPIMFQNGEWKTYSMPHGRQERRGVIVNVYTCFPSTLQGLRSHLENVNYYR